MASVHFARLSGAQGFSRTVAAKRLLPRLGRDREFSLMLIDEARVAARIHHPNVVSTLDVVQTEDELVLVMDYVHGESVATLMRSVIARNETVPYPIALAIMIDTLHGLHAAHEAKDEHGVALDIVHRDVSPQNLLVATDGVTRIVDFGVAKAAGRLQATADGVVKGKLAYMAPEQIDLGEATRQTDIFAASVVLWELLTGTRLFGGSNAGHILHQVLNAQIPKASSVAPSVPPELDAILDRGLAASPVDRYATALEMARALEACAPPIRPAEVGAWVSTVAAETLARRAQMRAAVEQHVPDEDDDADDGDSRTAPHELDVRALAAERGSASPFSGTPRSGGARPSQEGAFGTRTFAVRPSTDPGGATDTSAVVASSPRGPRRRNHLGLAALALLLVAILIGWSFVRGRATDAREATPAAQPAPPAPLPVASNAPQNVATVVIPVPSASSASKPLPPPAKVRAGSTAPRPARPRAGECDPPYSIDAAGHHIFKVQCM